MEYHPNFIIHQIVRVDNLGTSSKSIIHQKSAACTVIFDTLGAKAGLIVACNRRLAFVGETRFMLNKHEANRLWRFYGLSSLHAEQARCESPMAIKGSKNSKKCKGDSIGFEISPQFYNPSKIRADNFGYILKWEHIRRQT